MKICTLCKIEQEINFFNKNKHRKDGLSNICKKCSKSKSKEYYKLNNSKHKTYVHNKRTEKRKEHKEKIKIIKQSGCSLCSEKEHCCLDFHHLDSKEKEKNVSTLVRENRSWESIKKELEKCILVCANCHRKIHAGLIEINATVAERTKVPDF